MLKTLTELLRLAPAERSAAAARHLHSGRPCPSPHCDHRQALTLTLQAPAGAAGAAEARVLALATDGPWLAAACLQAVLIGASLSICRDSDDLVAALADASRDATLYIVAAPERLTSHTLARLYHAADPLGPDRPGWAERLGLFTARDAAALVRLIYRSAAARATGIPGTGVLITCAEELPQVPEAPPAGLSILGRDAATAARLSALPLDQVGSLSFVAHGRDDILWLRDALVCGRGPAEAPGGEFGGLPSCAHADQCYQPQRQLLDPVALATPLVFINSCASLKPAKSVFPTRFNVGLRFLDGATCALVASPLMTNGKLWQNLLFQFLLHSGRTLGAAVQIVNQATARSGLDFAGLHLIGDPTLTVSAPSPTEPVPWPGDDFAQPGRIATGGSPFCEVILPAPPRGPLTITAAERLPAQRPVYYALAQTGAGRRLFLFSLWPLPPHLTLTFTPGDELAGLRAAAGRGLATIRHAEWLGIRDQQLDRLVPELQQSLRSVQAVGQSQRYSLQAAALARRRCRHVAELEERIADLVLNWLLAATRERNLQLYETYRETYTAGGWVWGEQDCYLCGDALVTFTAANALVADQTRAVSLCPTCGIIEDRPGDLRLRFAGPTQLGYNEDLPLTLTLTNTGPTHLSGLAGAAVVNSVRYGLSATPERFAFSLPPGAAAAYRFVLRATAATPPHHFWLRAYAVCSGQITSAGANFWVSQGVGPCD